ncbi:NAD(P)-dependent oxidoreductase [Gordonia sp. NPDC127522]|uniref:NAD(P)-dependent oxidoreductase n=1 Tax=Gordonia sp. NPDC127522 TaxID=3345390 RepID=UPI003637A2DE
MNRTRVGFVGTGHIGEPMVERLLAEGRHPISVYARRDDVRKRLYGRGAVLVEQPTDLAANEVVIACLFDDRQLIEVISPVIERMRPGSIMVSHTTGSPTRMRRLAELGASRGVAVVEAPFSGTPEAIRQGALTVLLAADDTAALDRAADVVSAYASPVHRVGPLGAALVAKLLNNALFAVCSQATLAALSIGRQLGVDDGSLLAVLADCSGGSTAGRYISRSGQSAADYSERLPRYLVKDLASVESVAAELGVDVGDLLAAARRGPMDLDPA